MASDAAAGLAGGCQCGAVRYRLEGEPTGANICHCRMCQKAGGAPFMAFGGVRMSEFVVTRGVISTFASSDIAERGFCARVRHAADLPCAWDRSHQRHPRQPRQSGRGGARNATWRRIEIALAGGRAQRRRKPKLNNGSRDIRLQAAHGQHPDRET